MHAPTRAAAGLAATTLALTALLPIAPSLAAVTHRAAAALPRTWAHHADVDGDGTRDRVVLVRGDDLKVRNGWGSGHFRVKVHLSSTGDTVGRRMHVDYYDGGRGDGWTPWYGAAQIDQRTGRDLVVGFTSGAHAEVYNVLALHRGRLVTLVSPGDGPETGWTLNSSAGTGSSGYRCTDDGVMTRLFYPNGQGTRYHIDRARYVLDNGWQQTKHVHYTVDADENGYPPAYTNDYPTFACKGLPSRW